MLLAFCRYFTRYIFFSKTRQWLLFLAVGGLFLSSMALIVLQSTMGGLQSKQIERSKAVSGHAVIILNEKSPKLAQEIREKILRDYKVRSWPEYEIELLLRHGKHITPVIVHGLSTRKNDGAMDLPPFLTDAILNEMIAPRDMAWRLKFAPDDKLQLIAPGHINYFLSEIPRIATVYVDDLIRTDVPEIDTYHVWASLGIIQNLIRKRAVNRLRIYGEADFEKMANGLKSDYGDAAEIKTWEDEHQTLVWALGLESTVMLFLFVSMTMLVSLCITSGLLILYDKIKNDLASFWILGASKKQLEWANLFFLNFISFVSVILGLGAGLAILYGLHVYGPDIMPDIFIDQKIPVKITPSALVISFIVPYIISMAFCLFTFNQFKNEQNYLEHVRSVGA